MNEFVRRMTAPIARLTTVVDVAHEPVFAEFARIVELQMIEERVRREPRVVSFRALRTGR